MTSTNVGRRRLLARRTLLSLSTMLCSGLAVPAMAQLAPPAPVRQSIDGNGVDLFAGKMNVNGPALTMGQGEPQGLAYYKFYRGAAWADNLVASANLVGSVLTVNLGGTSDSFTVSGSTYTPTEANGATLSYNSGTSLYTYTRADGTVMHFDKARNGLAPYYASEGRITDLTLPTGAKVVYTYDSLQYCSSSKPAHSGQTCLTHAFTYRVASLRNSYGYKLSFSYGTIDPFDPNDASSPPDFYTWSTVLSASMTNLALTSGASTPTQSFSSGGSTFSITDPMSRVTSYRMTSDGLAGITRPGSGSEDVTIAYTSGRITGVTTAAGTTSYASSDLSGVRTVTVTDPQSHATTYAFDIASQRMTSTTDALSHITRWDYDTSGRLTKTTLPEGNYTQLTYDGRGNVTQSDVVAKSGSGVSTISTYASFDATCSSAAKCNQPNTTTDANGNVTTYSYDSTTGNVTSVKGAAPTTGAVQPETRYSYSSLQAYFQNSGGSIVASGEPVSLLTGISTCQTTATCATTHTADEIATGIGYGPQTTGTGNNLLPISVSKGAGDASLTATTAMAYDDVGNLTSVDGPLSGTADMTTYRYDADREQVGVIGADPDGAGSRKRIATRATYDSKGRVTLAESGNVNGTTDTDWSGFSAAQATATSYDGVDRPLTVTLKSGSTSYALTQTSYTGTRLECAAVRMNSATWGSLPSSACTATTTGSYGADRITKPSYDTADRVTKVQTAYGTGDQADEQTATYNNNGTIATLTDANGNKTSYSYDGVDRLIQTSYPSPTTAGTSSTSDYEQLVYDAASNVTSRRLRGYASDSTRHIDLSYDHLNRLTTKDLPGSELDVTYTYDLLNRPLSAVTTAQTLSFTYDALSRNVTQVGPQGTVSAQYDLADRRTRTTWPDSFYVTYDRSVTGEVTAVRENGATSGVGVLATYAYDDLGRRTGITRGNGTSTSYGFDSVSRLASLGHDLSGTTNDLTLGFGYTPANQIASTTRSNYSYAWTGSANRNDASSTNGLNQTTIAGSTSIGYDVRGNTTSIGSNSYTYSSENLLLTGPSTNLTYDPLMRLYGLSGSATEYYAYDGVQRIGEYNGSGTLQRRYVFGPGDDEPLVWYEGSGTTDRRWLHADERGSVVATSDSSGAKLAINSYDEYGVPASGNSGKFQYTGQAWLPSLGVAYYKARMYTPTLGRFLQTDPIGYGDGMNWYNYVGGDPVNEWDSTGLDGCIQISLDDGVTWTPTSSGCLDHSPMVAPPIEADDGEDTDWADYDAQFGGLTSNGHGGYYYGWGAGPIAPDAPVNTPATLPQNDDIVVTAKKYGQKAIQCAADHYGLGALGIGGAASGANALATRGKFGGAIPGTSVASRAASAIFGDAKLPFRVPTLVGFPLVGEGVAVRFTSSIARVAGRGVPVLGWALLAYDVGSIAICTASE